MITGVLPFTESDHWPGDQAPSDLDTERRQRERKKRYENVVHWCENFGALRKIERKEDGSLHVYWRDWEVADMVSPEYVQSTLWLTGRRILRYAEYKPKFTSKVLDASLWRGITSVDAL